MTLIIFGLDGASIENISMVKKSVDLPNFSKAMSEGTHASLISVYPYVTAPAWTSIFSGVNPGSHGIFDMLEFKGNRLAPPNMRNSDAPFLWDYATWAGKKVLVIGVPFVHPAPVINGVFVTGRFVPTLSTHPESLREEMNLSGYEYRRISARKRWKKIQEKGMASFAEPELERLRERVRTSLGLLDSRTWDVAIVVDELPDKLFHYAFKDPQIVGEMFRELDKWLGELMIRIGTDDALLVVSDHGFGESRGKVFVGEWLRRKGYRISRRNYRESLAHPKGRLGRTKEIRQSLGKLRNSMLAPTRRTNLMTIALEYFSKRAVGSRRALALSNRKSLNVTFTTPGRAGGRTAWLASRLDGSPASDDDILIEDLRSLKRAGLLKDVLRSQDIFYGPHTEGAPGSIIIEAPDGWSIDPHLDKSRRLTSRAGPMDQGLHQREGMLTLFGLGHLDLNRTPNVFDILPTALDYLGLPVPESIDGASLLNNSVQGGGRAAISR